VRLSRIIWTNATDAERRACGEWLAKAGLRVIACAVTHNGQHRYAWAIRRTTP